MTVYGLLADNLPARAEKIALIDAARSVTYGGLAAEAGRVASWLLMRGVRPGDRVIVHLRKGIDEVAAMFAVWRIGAVVVNVNVQWTAAQLAYVASDCRATVAIVGDNVLAALAKVTLPPSLAHLLVRGGSLVPDGAGLWDDSLLAASPGATPQAAPEIAPDEQSLAMIIYTSGSTGQPKGVMLSHANIRIGAEAVSEYLQLGPDDRLLSVLPYSFDAGLNQLTTMMLNGGTVVHQPVIMAAEVLRMARDHAVTGLAGVPPLWNQIVRLLREAPMDLPALRRITNTGGKIPPDILDAMPRVFPGVDIYLMYGLTEAFRSTYLPPERFARKRGAIGQGIPRAQVFVIRHGVGIAGPGEQGELVHAGPLVSLGYWERPEMTAQKIRPCPELAHLIGDTPVVYSGDMVRIDDEGDYWFVGRMDDMIKTLGFRLSPTEVEDLVSLSGLVADVVAFGVEDDDHGQVVHVATTLLPNASEAAMMVHCRRSMAHYMVPRRVYVWPGAMPRMASGKLDRPAVIGACKAGLM